ncbi:MAG: hypothetical protein WC506_03865 [Candidatus Micrarchaeia archaeon]
MARKKTGAKKAKPKDEKSKKHFMLFEVSSKDPIKLNMKVIEYIPGKKAAKHKVLVPKKVVKGKKIKSQEDEIVSEIFDQY